MKKRLFPLLILSILVLAALVGGVVSNQVQATAPTSNEKTHAADIESSFNETMGLIESRYADKIDHEVLTKASIKGMLRTLDPHSNYLDPKDLKDLKSEQHSQFYGIGVTINRRNNRVYILSTIKGTPADRAGLRYGDAILTVDGKPATDWSTLDVMEHVRGPKGEPVEIEVQRAGVPKPLTFKIVRDAVSQPSIRNAYMIQPGIGYIGLIYTFSHTTEEELLRSIDGLKAQGMRALILDIRNNPGGLLAQATKVSNV